VPQPAATACGARVCGSAPDGCGGFVHCGDCATGEVCDSGQGQCHTGCGGADPTTLTCFGTQDKATSSPARKCSTCVQNNGCLDPAQQGGTCEAVAGNAALFSGVLPDGQTCSQVVGTSPISESAICFQTLVQVFTSQCAATLQETPCLCGATDVYMCMDGSATPTGPLYDEYACDFGGTSGPTITALATDFTVPTFGAGTANSLIQCAAAFSCDCF
jgi:hypothetical protein